LSTAYRQVTQIVLLGDSIFDNAAYVDGEADAITKEWKATLRAVDGSVVASVRRQMLDLPADVIHPIVSVGGNDALGQSRVMDQPARSTAEVLNRLADAGEEFENGYHELLRTVLTLKLPTAICTIYNPRFPEPSIQRLAVTALSVFNDVIVREAIAAGIPLLDLRLICNEDSDYANPIEPSAAGGGKIARAILRVVQDHRFAGRTEVFI
jgi:lysophospholipase L1-like esterase